MIVNNNQIYAGLSLAPKKNDNAKNPQKQTLKSDKGVSYMEVPSHKLSPLLFGAKISKKNHPAFKGGPSGSGEGGSQRLEELLGLDVVVENATENTLDKMKEKVKRELEEELKTKLKTDIENEFEKKLLDKTEEYVNDTKTGLKGELQEELNNEFMDKADEKFMTKSEANEKFATEERLREEIEKLKPTRGVFAKEHDKDYKDYFRDTPPSGGVFSSYEPRNPNKPWL